MASPHVLLVGGGHASVALLRRARAWTASGAARVTLLNEHPTLYYSGMVPEYLGGVYDARAVQIDLRGWCRRAGVAWHHGRAARLAPERRVVETAAGKALPFDLAVFDIGARNPEGPPRAVPTKPLHRVEEIERFVREALHASPRRHLVIAGGGAAGVEVALNVSARARQAVPGGGLHLTIVEPGTRLLFGFPEGMSARVHALLHQRGVQVHLGATLDATDGEHATLSNGMRLRCDELLWATGSIGQPVFREAGLACDENDFVHVRPTLQCEDASRIFAAGDCARVEGHETLARVGVHAVKQGPLLAANVERAIEALRAGRALSGTTFDSFSPYPVAPLILSTGTREGLWSAGRFWMRGTWALRLKHFIDLRWMNQYRLNDCDKTSVLNALHARSAHDGSPLLSSPTL